MKRGSSENTYLYIELLSTILIYLHSWPKTQYTDRSWDLNILLHLVYFHIWLVYKEEFEDTKGVIRILKSKDRQYNGQMTKDKKKDKQLNDKGQKKKTNNYLQNNTHKTKE